MVLALYVTSGSFRGAFARFLKGNGIHSFMLILTDQYLLCVNRNIVVDTAISAQPFGREMPLRCV